MRCLMLYFRDKDCGFLEAPCTYLHHALKIICNRRENFGWGGHFKSRCYLRNQMLSSGAIEVELKASGLSGITFQVQYTHIPKHMCAVFVIERIRNNSVLDCSVTLRCGPPWAVFFIILIDFKFGWGSFVSELYCYVATTKCLDRPMQKKKHNNNGKLRCSERLCKLAIVMSKQFHTNLRLN